MTLLPTSPSRPLHLVRALRHRLSAARIARGRQRFARGHLAGHGLEIGALHAPFPLPPGATASYVDRLPVDQLRHHYPELVGEPFVEVDIVDPTGRMAELPEASQAFVLAIHVLEHCEDPLGMLAAWLRVLRPGGVLLLAVPDRRFTFDRLRPATSLDHLFADRAAGRCTARPRAYAEWVACTEQLPPDQAEARARELERTDYSIHFHVWDAAALTEMLKAVAGAELVSFARNRSENLALLRRPAP